MILAATCFAAESLWISRRVGAVPVRAAIGSVAPGGEG